MIERERQNREIKEDDQKLPERSMMPEERRIAWLVREVGSVTTGSLEAEFGISPMTARRDLASVEEGGFGGSTVERSFPSLQGTRIHSGTGWRRRST